MKRNVAKLILASIAIFLSASIQTISYAATLSDKQAVVLEAYSEYRTKIGDLTTDTISSGEETYQSRYEKAGGRDTIVEEVRRLSASRQTLINWTAKSLYDNNPQADDAAISEKAEDFGLTPEELTASYNEVSKIYAATQVDLSVTKDSIKSMFGVHNFRLYNDYADILLFWPILVINVIITMAMRIWGYFLVGQTIIDAIAITLPVTTYVFKMFRVKKSRGAGDNDDDYYYLLLSREARDIIGSEGGFSTGGSSSQLGGGSRDTAGGGQMPIVKYVLTRLPSLMFGATLIVLVAGDLWVDLIASLGTAVSSGLSRLI